MNELMLYHVSFNLLDENELVPRVPVHRLKNEDMTTNRICFSETIEGCLNSMPYGAKALRGFFKLRTEDWKKPVLFIYAVTVTEDNKCSFIPPTDLRERYGVEDAVTHGEHWAIKKPDNIIMTIVELESAIFYEAQSISKESRLLVKDIAYNLKRYTGEQMQMIRNIYAGFKSKGVDMRRHGLLHDKYKELDNERLNEYKRNHDSIYDVIFRFNIAIFLNNEIERKNIPIQAGKEEIDMEVIQQRLDRIESKIDAYGSMFNYVCKIIGRLQRFIP